MVPLRITLRNTELSQAEATDLRRRVARLERYAKPILHGRVTIEVPQHRRRVDSDRYAIRIDLELPGGTVIVDRQPHEGLGAALQQAFSAARRRIQDHMRRRRGAVKHHDDPRPVPASLTFDS
ncbi:MAG: HPF/RaiA family ribosome-associated protein [Gemmatimonadales bacterium]